MVNWAKGDGKGLIMKWGLAKLQSHLIILTVDLMSSLSQPCTFAKFNPRVNVGSMSINLEGQFMLGWVDIT